MKDNDIKKLFDNIKPNNDKKDEIYKKIIEADRYKQSNSFSIKNNNRRSSRFRPAIILAIILIFSMTVFAVSNKEPTFSDKIKNFTLTEDAQDIDVSDTDKGYTIRAESIFGDDKFAYVLFSLEREDGKDISSFQGEKSNSLWSDAETQYITKDKYIKNEESPYMIYGIQNYYINYKEDNLKKAYYLKAYNIDLSDENNKNIIGGKLNLDIKKIYAGIWGFATKGDWKLEIPLEYKNLSEIYQINKFIKFKGKDILVEKIRFSELNAILYFKSEDGMLQQFSEDIFQERFWMSFRLKDGTIIEGEDDTASGDIKGTHYYHSTYIYNDERIDPKKIKSILLDDIEIDVDLK